MKKKREKEEWYEVAERVRNFYFNFDPSDENLEKNKDFFVKLSTLIKKDIIVYSEPNLKLKDNAYSYLRYIFLKIYDLTAEKYPAYMELKKSSLYANPVLYDKIFDAFLFTALCTFLNHSKKLKGKSLGQFLYDNEVHQEAWNQDKIHNDIDFLKKEEKLKQKRYRLLSKRETYLERDKWDAMSKDSEHEWTLDFELEKSKNKAYSDTYKRLKNLYNDIDNAIALAYKEHKYDTEALKTAYAKFTSKLKKIKYCDFISLGEFILSHICKDKQYYGINIYRFEKEMSFYKITYEVNRLLRCKNDEERDCLLRNAVILNQICYSKIYDELISILNPMFLEQNNLSFRFFYVNLIKDFSDFKTDIVFSFLLAADELVDKGYLGEDWQDLFLNTINAMTERIFYNPDEIDYSISPNSQERYMEFLEYFVKLKIKSVLNQKNNNAKDT